MSNSKAVSSASSESDQVILPRNTKATAYQINEENFSSANDDSISGDYYAGS